MIDPLVPLNLADFVAARQDAILEEWLRSVRAHPTLSKAGELSVGQLKDTLPQLCQRLCDRLREIHLTANSKSVEDLGQTHGEHRWEQSFSLTEILREISILRTIFVRQLADFRTANPGLRTEEEVETSILIHVFFDELIINSTVRFAHLQQQKIDAADLIIAGDARKLEELNAHLRLVDERRLQMLRNVAHETRNHLNAISMGVAFLAVKAGMEETREDLERLKRNVQDIIALTSNLLELGSLLCGAERARWESFTATEMFDSVAVTLSQMASQKGLAFSANLDGSFVVVADRLMVQRIVLNLGTNAIKYTREGTVTLRFAPRDEGFWMLEVTDTGPGIPPAERERIFEEFYRIPGPSMDKPGVGLGLAIVRQLVTLLHGRIELESEVGKGTCFRVIFPRERQQQAA